MRESRLKERESTLKTVGFFLQQLNPYTTHTCIGIITHLSLTFICSFKGYSQTQEKKMENFEEAEIGLTFSQLNMVDQFQNLGFNSRQVCRHFVRTGRCKFGHNCWYDHSKNRLNQVGEGVSAKMEEVECKFYLREGGCKYGESCRFNHLQLESVKPHSELNSLGLPIRLGERKCPFYMRNRSCGYGARCRFHHPDPTSFEEADPCDSTLNYENVGQFDHYSGNFNCESVQASWYMPMIADYAVSDLDNRSFYMPSTNFLPHGLHRDHESSGYQGPDYSPASTNLPQLAPPAYSDIKYRDQEGDDTCAVNDWGLPLRPGKEVCSDYERHGLCRRGPACLYDHPTHMAWALRNGSK